MSSKLSTILAGCDGGNGLFKAVFDISGTRREVKIPSYVHQTDESESFTNPPGGAVVHYIGGPRTDLVGSQWLIGSTAYTNYPDIRRAVVEAGDGKVQYGLQLFLGAIATLGLASPDISIKVVVSVHNKSVFAQRMISAYNGRHQVRLNGAPMMVEITAGCVEEGAGAIHYLQSTGQLDKSIQQVAILDLGHGTTASRVVNLDGQGGFATIPGSVKVVNNGVRMLLTGIANDPSLSQRLDGTADIEVIRVSLERTTQGSNPGMLYGLTNFTMRTAYSSKISKWAEDCLAVAVDSISRWQATATFYAIGGGTQLPGVKEKLTAPNTRTGRPGFTVIDNAQMANSYGLLMAAGRLK